jgi:hypothetical protein
LIRRPSADEVALARRFLGTAPGPAAWNQLAQALLLSNEFIYCD